MKSSIAAKAATTGGSRILGVLAALLCLSGAAQAQEAPGWQQSLRAELAKCESEGNFFKHRACTEKARWKYCSKPGHSDMAAECRVDGSQGGSRRPAPEWVHPLRNELAKCERLGFFKSQACIEKARWKYCRGRWDQAAECGKKPEKNTYGDVPR